MNQSETQIISIEVEDKPGVMTRISSLFSRRGFNVISLSVGRTHKPGISRFTITTEGDQQVLEQIRKQCQKLIHVLKTHNLKVDRSVLREFTMVKLSNKAEHSDKIAHMIDFYGGRLLDITDNALIIEFSGSTEKITTVHQKLSELDVLESIRTGTAGMLKGK